MSRYCDGIDVDSLPKPKLETAIDPYQWQAAENAAKHEEKLELPPMQTYANMPSINGYRF